MNKQVKISLFCPQEGHPDRTEIQKCMTAFKNLSVSYKYNYC